MPPESPTLGFTHLQFEALLTAARDSAHPCGFALVAMLGLLGLRVFEATGAGIGDLGEEHGRLYRVCREADIDEERRETRPNPSFAESLAFEGWLSGGFRCA